VTVAIVIASVYFVAGLLLCLFFAGADERRIS